MKKKISRLLMILVLTLSLFICNSEGFDRQQHANDTGFFQTTSTLQNSQGKISGNAVLSEQKNSTSVNSPETYIYLPKSDYTIGEVINISGLTTIHSGEQLYIEIYTTDYHVIPKGKTSGLAEQVTVRDSDNKSYAPFFITVNTTILLHGDWYISVSHIDRKSNATYLNSTTFVLHDSVSKQSGSPVIVTVLIAVSALGLVLSRKTKPPINRNG